MICIFKTFISHDSSERRVLAIYIVSTLNPKEGKDMENTEDNSIVHEIVDRHDKITDLVAFKSSKELYPLCSPFLDIRAKGARSKL